MVPGAVGMLSGGPDGERVEVVGQDAPADRGAGATPAFEACSAGAVRRLRDVARQADPPTRATSPATAWTAGELRRFVAQVEGDRLFALWRLAATTGMRRGELAGLTWRALDLDGARLAVEQQLVPTRGGVTLGPLKSARSRRTVALDLDTVAALGTHGDAQPV